MPKKYSIVKNKWILAGVSVLTGASFISYAMLFNPLYQQNIDGSYQEIFNDSKLPLTTIEQQNGAVTRPNFPKNEKINIKPEFVTARDYKTATAIAKIYEYALNPQQEEMWLKERLATRAQREATLRAQSRQAEAKAELEREKYVQQKEAIKNGTYAGTETDSTGQPLSIATRSMDENWAQKPIPIIKIRGYTRASKYNSSSAALEIDGETYANIVKGSIIAGISVTQLNDESECVSMVNTRGRLGSNSKLCM